MNIPVFDIEGNKVDNFNAPDSIFSIDINENILYHYRIAYLANQRQGTTSALTRSEVKGGGRKPWRQKHTGRARAGSIRSPLWRHGGVIFPPKPRDYSMKLSKDIKKRALLMSLADRAKENLLYGFSGVFEKPSTKIAYRFLSKAGFLDKKVVYVDGLNKNNYLSFRNIENVNAISLDNINAYMVMWSDVVLFNIDALKKFIERYGN